MTYRIAISSPALSPIDHAHFLGYHAGGRKVRPVDTVDQSGHRYLFRRMADWRAETLRRREPGFHIIVEATR